MTQNYWYIKAKTTEEMDTTANVVHVENLSERIKANREYMLRTIRGSKILNL